MPFDINAFSAEARADHGVALAFDGVDDFLEVANTDQPERLSSFTVEAWVKLDDVRGIKPIWGTTFGNEDNPEETIGFSLLVIDNWIYPFGNFFERSQDTLLGERDFDQLAANGHVGQPPIKNGLESNRWYHVAFVLEHTGSMATFGESSTSSTLLTSMSLYVNGELRGKRDQVKTRSNHLDLQNMVIGRHEPLPGRGRQHFFKGELDEIRIWQQALPLENIREHHRTNSLTTDLVTLRINWAFDEGRGDIVSNLAADDYSATRHGTSWKLVAADRNQAASSPDETVPPIPVLVLIEHYRLSSFRGSYGPGRIVNTVSLLPGEKTEISVSTFASQSSSQTLKKELDESTSNKTSRNISNASSIFEGANEETSDSFAKQISSENERRTNKSDNFNWDVSASGGAAGGVWHVEGSASAGGSINVSRDEMARDVANATNEHASRSAAKREVKVDSVTDINARKERVRRIQESQTTSVSLTNDQTDAQIRTLENINVSRTLNFVFRQMNQQYITLLHMIDLEIGFQITGQPETRRVVPLTSLDRLLDEVIEADSREQVRQQILHQIQTILDFNGETVDGFIQEVQAPPVSATELSADPIHYHRVNRKFMSNYTDAKTSMTWQVPGIIIDVNENIMRTEHLYADSFLGLGEALDEYSQGLQKEAIENEQLHNELLRTEVYRNKQLIDINKAAMQIVAREDTRAASVFNTVFGDTPTHENGVSLPALTAES
jgi:hypothetical protein